jgi:UDP-N-acetyl-D-glucosamine dehydrogenase
LTVPVTREHPDLRGRESVPLSAAAVARHDAVLIATDHDAVDYELIVENAQLILDTRNVLGRLRLAGKNVVKA